MLCICNLCYIVCQVHHHARRRMIRLDEQILRKDCCNSKELGWTAARSARGWDRTNTSVSSSIWCFRTTYVNERMAYTCPLCKYLKSQYNILEHGLSLPRSSSAWISFQFCRSPNPSFARLEKVGGESKQAVLPQQRGQGKRRKDEDKDGDSEDDEGVELLTPTSHISSSKMVQRVAIRSRKSYNTKSNRRRIIKTPCEL